MLETTKEILSFVWTDVIKGFFELLWTQFVAALIVVALGVIFWYLLYGMVFNGTPM